MAVLIAVVVVLALAGSAEASSGEITRAWTNGSWDAGYFAGSVTVTPDYELTIDYSSGEQTDGVPIGRLTEMPVSPGEPQLWSDAGNAGLGGPPCPRTFGPVEGFEDLSTMLWQMGSEPVEGTFPLPTTPLAIPRGQPCIYLVIDTGGFYSCVPGWPYALREYCPREFHELYETLAVARLRLSPRVACSQARTEARSARAGLRSARHRLYAAKGAKAKRRFRRALTQWQNASQRASAQVTRVC